MTLPSVSLMNQYTGNGAANLYAYGFFIFDESHLQVFVQDTSGNIYPLVLNVDYTVSGELNPTGGSIALINNNQAFLTQPQGNLIANYTITIQRVVPLVQDTNIRDQGAGYQSAIEDALDYLTMCVQQLAYGITPLVTGNGQIISPSGLIVTDPVAGKEWNIIVQSGVLGIQEIT